MFTEFTSNGVVLVGKIALLSLFERRDVALCKKDT